MSERYGEGDVNRRDEVDSVEPLGTVLGWALIAVLLFTAIGSGLALFVLTGWCFALVFISRGEWEPGMWVALAWVVCVWLFQKSNTRSVGDHDIPGSPD